MYKIFGVFLLGVILWFMPVPEGMDPQAWQLFTIFIVSILSVVFRVFSILLASVLGLVLAVFTQTLSPDQAFSGFSNDIVLLIVMAFLIAKAMVKSGLGIRMALLLIKRFGKSALGLAYSLLMTDMLIAPAFPSNTARSGVLFPIVFSVAQANGSDPEKGTEKKLGSYLMFTSMAGIGLSSAMWLTAMAVNPVGAAMVSGYGVDIHFANWVLAASVPTMVAALLLPWVLLKVYPPEIKFTPSAASFAKEELKKRGGMSRNEKITLGIFILLVMAWSLSELFGIDRTATAFLGLGLLLLTGVYTPADIRKEGEALVTMIWFAILFAMSMALYDLGFMSHVGLLISKEIEMLSKPLAFLVLVFIYVLFHYLFVSQTAHLLALFGVFISAGADLGLYVTGLAFMLLFATNYFSVITPQGSSCNVLYISSGYISVEEVYKYGGLLTLFFFVIYNTVGLAWVFWIF
ncbi:DASS family sodium-coupled anion symporter [Cecembia lonarensis]|uniref:Inner membrane protein ybhI n=1 Tax=Cecembia lonarensis (strain CCUG 58316 / KCTC 22772 / LW9) TaxID=1225176 RepID=K1LJW8_CECL9|nr:DASS family sodium-coupled anion symporter [Cecembia lonarensis]EKB50618.1 Inner membrane protein ybhI [Cecembia lonarensis LW9]